MSDLSPLSGEERKWNFGAVRSVGTRSGHPTAVPVEPSKHPNPTQATTNLDLHQGAVRSHCAFFTKKHTMVALRNGR